MKNYTISALMALSLLGCGQNNQDLETKIIELTARAVSLETEVESLRASVSILQQPKNGFVLLDTASKNYQLVETNIGPLFVVFKDAKPYLNGQKLRIALGNPLFTTYSGAELKFNWGNALNYENSGEGFTEWSKTLQEKTVKITNTLNPGSWNEIEVILTPATPAQLGYLDLTIKLDQLSLRP